MEVDTSGVPGEAYHQGETGDSHLEPSSVLSKLEPKSAVSISVTLTAVAASASADLMQVRQRTPYLVLRLLTLRASCQNFSISIFPYAVIGPRFYEFLRRQLAFSPVYTPATKKN